jgi:indolepyruvate ferredoxin oxidoreductase
LRAVIREALDGGPAFDIGASHLATALTGDSIGTNILMLGYAAQKGLLPLSLRAIEEAIRLNGSFVEGNLHTLNLGRLAAHDPEALAAVVGEEKELAKLHSVDDVLASRVRLLTAYQSAGYAKRYGDFVAGIRERVAAKRLEGGESFVREVALTLGRLMAYKDEYEVARLYSHPDFMAGLQEQFDGDFTLRFNLAPPVLPGREASGRPKKREFGPWMIHAFKLLAKLKSLRGTPLDIFGYFPERRMERRLIGDYRALVEDVADRLDADNLEAGIAVAAAARDIAGYGPVKDQAVEDYERCLPGLLAAMQEKRGSIPVRLAQTRGADGGA